MEFPLNIDFYIPDIFSKSIFNSHKVTKKTKARFLFSWLLCGLFFLQPALYDCTLSCYQPNKIGFDFN